MTVACGCGTCIPVAANLLSVVHVTCIGPITELFEANVKCFACGTVFPVAVSEQLYLLLWRRVVDANSDRFRVDARFAQIVGGENWT